MKYLILVHSNPTSRAHWQTLTEAEQLAFGRAHYALHEELLASGDLVFSEGLTDPASGTWVSVRAGQTMTSDGPYAETKEYVAGLYCVDVADMAAAVALAARVPDAAFNHVEVRPVFDHTVLDL